MPYSRDPESFSKIFYDILDLALRSDQRIEVIGDAKKLLRKFYAFKDAWKARAESTERLGNFPLAAEHRKRVSALLRYQGVIEPGKLVLLHKDMLSDQLGERVSGSGQTVVDPLLGSAEDFAKLSLGILDKAQPGTPALSPVPQENIAMKLFGVDTSAPREQPVAPVPQTEEEKALMEQIRREQEETGDKHVE